MSHFKVSTVYKECYIFEYIKLSHRTSKDLEVNVDEEVFVI